MLENYLSCPQAPRPRASSVASLPTPPASTRKRARSESGDEDTSKAGQGTAKRQCIWDTPRRSLGRPTCNGLVLGCGPSNALPSPPSSDPAPLPPSPTPRDNTCPALPPTPAPRKRPIRDTPNNIFLACYPAEPDDSRRAFELTPDPRGEIPVMVYLL